MIDLRNAVIPENENNVINVIEKILRFNKQENGKGPKTLTFKQILQRLPIAFAQVKTGNTSKSLLNGICQMIYSLHRVSGITKKSIQQYNEFNKVIIQNGYYIYEF